MLKIKNSIELEVLKKYGFKDEIYDYEKVLKNGKYIIDVPTTFNDNHRIIFHKKKGAFYIVTKPRKRLIKDLIKDGLVEKVE